MRSKAANPLPGFPAKRLTAVLLVLLVIFLSTLAQDVGLHKAIHADAGSADHQCAVTFFAHGQIFHGLAGPLLLLVPLAILFSSALPESTQVRSRHFLLPPSCGPPSASL